MANIIKFYMIAFLFSAMILSCATSQSSEQTDSVKRISPSTQALTNTSKALADTSMEARVDKFKAFEKQLDIAIQKRQGRRIWKFLTEESREWFEYRIEDAMYLSKPELSRLEFHDQFVILALRQAKLAGWVNSFETNKLIRILFSKGPVHQAFVKEQRAEVQIEGKLAKQGLARSPKVPIYFYKFEFDVDKERDRWRLDLYRMLPIISRGLQTVAHKQDMTYTEAIAFMLAQSTGRDFGEKLFEPLEG